MKGKTYIAVFVIVAAFFITNTILLILSNNGIENLIAKDNQLMSKIRSIDLDVTLTRSEISELKNIIMEPLELVRTVEYELISRDGGKANLKVTLTFSEQMEDQKFFVVLNNETKKERERIELDRSATGYSRVIEFSTSDKYSYQVVTEIGGKEIYSDRYEIYNDIFYR